MAAGSGFKFFFFKKQDGNTSGKNCIGKGTIWEGEGGGGGLRGRGRRKGNGGMGGNSK